MCRASKHVLALILEKCALMAANNRIYPKIASLVIYEVLIDNTLDRAAIFPGHSYLDSTPVLSDIIQSKWYNSRVNIYIGAFSSRSPIHI